MLKPITQLPPFASPSSQPNHRKRAFLDVSPINMVDSSRFVTTSRSPKPPIFSGGRDDLRPLALLEKSVKKPKSPNSPPSYGFSRSEQNSKAENSSFQSSIAEPFYEGLLCSSGLNKNKTPL
ncbi:hypothetical protein AAHA92_07379 [Salvia divinorum]|uniref:Uncharacterized protein n=1 Tax=Salvia divinorum TaxID=28513 RepID=A0ABD1I8S2_SALDI